MDKNPYGFVVYRVYDNTKWNKGDVYFSVVLFQRLETVLRIQPELFWDGPLGIRIFN